MRIRAVLIASLVMLAVPAAAGGGFFTDEELAQIDDALTLLNMTRKDLEFDKLVLDDDWRLPVVNRTLAKPLEAADVAADWAATAMLRPSRVLTRAVKEVESVLFREGAPLDETERDSLRRWAYAALVEDDAHDGLVPRPTVEQDPETMLALAMRVDLRDAIEQALTILAVVEQVDACRILAESTGARGVPDDWRMDVRISGPGDDVHDLRKDPPRILIDLGGNDRYLAPARATPDHPVAVVVDLGGDDIYGNGESLSCGAGFFGVGMLLDYGGGDDRYRGGHLSQGVGLFGIGILVDDGGNDVYRCRDTGQGAGAWGIGLLLDRGEGNDTFHADLFGQGFAYVGGFGLLHNEKGQDLYEAGGVHLHYPLFNDRYQSLSQGFSIGMRPYASGGIGLLVDDSGNDRYACDIYGQGASYWFSYGALVDKDGNDSYTLGQYGQGGGIHLAVGCLLDLAGQDLYYNMHGVGTGGAHDFAVGLLVDRAGDDYYAGSGGTLGGALTNSFALLLDAAGNDGYSAVKVRHTEGGGRAARGMGSIGLFLDLAGKDLHGTRELEETSWTKETYGAGIDRPDPPPVESAKPAGRPTLTAEDVEKRIRDDAWDEERKAYDPERLWAVASRWAVGEMADVVPVAIRRFIALGDPAFEKALSRIATRSGLELRAVRAVLKAFGEKALPALVKRLGHENELTRASAASLLADLGAKDAATRILVLLEHEKTKRAALDALARLGVKSHWEAVAALLTDPNERTRVSAARCLQKLAASPAVPQLVSRLAGTEIFTVRFAAEDVLVSLGSAAVADLCRLARMDGDPTARRHAIRALGRMAAPDALPLLVRLSEHEDWRIRYDVMGALAGYREEGGTRSMLASTVLGDRSRDETHPHVRSRLARLTE